MRVLSLCSGIGGIDLACEWAGFQIVGQIENNPFCQMILRQHWPGIPLLSDLKEVATYEKEKLEAIFGRVDILVGGIPCQPFSSAGKRRGIEDDRHLWPYAAALVKKLQPAWVVIENVRNFANMALDLVLSDLESLQYEAGAFVFPACATGAPHIRERCFILAYHSGLRRGAWRAESAGQQGQSNLDSDGSVMANAQHGRCAWGSQLSDQSGADTHASSATARPEPQSRLGRVLARISAKLDSAKWPAGPGEQYEWEPPRTIKGKQKWRRQRLEALGNAVNPYQVYPFFELIRESEALS